MAHMLPPRQRNAELLLCFQMPFSVSQVQIRCRKQWLVVYSVRGSRSLDEISFSE
jgi:hypothetical protein